MKDKNLYLNIIKGRPEVRPYKTKKNIIQFSWFQVCDGLGLHEIYKGASWDFYINDIYYYLIHVARVVYTSPDGVDRLTDKGLALYYGR
jgi:hypothetical protein